MLECKRTLDLNSFLSHISPFKTSYLSRYLKDIFREIGNGHIIKSDFREYMEIPVFVSDKLFCLFDEDNDGILSLKEFVNGFIKVCNGSPSDIIEFVFDLCDLNKDGYIISSDIRLILIYLSKHLFNKGFITNFDESKILTLLDFYFRNDGQTLHYSDFFDLTVNYNSELFLTLFTYILKCLPFSSTTLELYKSDKRIDEEETQYQVSKIGNDKKLFSENKSGEELFIQFPHTYKNIFCEDFCEIINRGLCLSSNEKNNKYEEFSRLENLIKSDTFIFSDNESTSIQSLAANKKFNNVKESECKENTDTTLSTSKSLVQIQVIRDFTPNLTDSTNENTLLLNRLRKYSDLFEDSPNGQIKNNLAKQNSESYKLVNIQDNAVISEYLNNLNLESEHQKLNNQISYESNIYKYDKIKNKMTKVFISLIGKELFYFKNSSKTKFKGMHYLRTFYTLTKNFDDFEQNVINFKDHKFYYFTLFINNKEREFYTKNIEVYTNWTNALRKAVNVRYLNDHYELLLTTYTGNYVCIKKGRELVNNRTVSIKIYSKAEIMKEQKKYDMLIKEKDILFNSNHKNIVKLYEFFEDLTYIYLIFEYLENENLFNYINNNKEQIQLEQSINIIKQLCEGMNYLHSNGIVHRDIKPHNICLTGDMIVKIIDFNFSCVIGENEFVNEPYGTLLFAPPEILLKYQYNKKVDIWSLGVTIYFLFFKQFLFKDEKSLANVVLNPMSVDVDVCSGEKFKNESMNNNEKYVTSLMEDLLTKCLKIDSKRRYNITEILNHVIFKSC